MKLLNPIRLSVGLAALFVAQSGWAAGTDAGTIVNNTATLTYSVGGATQTPITSPVADFTVDRKVDLTVDGNSPNNYEVAPLSLKNSAGDTNVLRYKLLNAGNAEQDFKISATHLNSEEFDALNCGIEVRDSVGSTTVVAGSPTTSLPGNLIVTIPEDEEYEVRVSCDMPDLGATPPTGGLDDGDLSTIEVLATAVDSGGATMQESASDAEDSEDVVLADGVGGAADVAATNSSTPASSALVPIAAGERNASHSDVQTFEIQAPELSVEKTSVVITDPSNCDQSNNATDTTVAACGSNSPKRIPGAIVEYTLTISNASDKAASGVAIEDILTNGDDTLGGVAVVDETVEFVSSSLVLSGASGATDASTTSGATHTVKVENITVPAHDGTNAGEAVIKFRVKVL